MMCFCLLHHNCYAEIEHRLNNAALSRLQRWGKHPLRTIASEQQESFIVAFSDRREGRL
jgi:hypothetical protein